MIWTAKELNSHLRNLTLCGVDFDKNFEWVGTDEQWEKADEEFENKNNGLSF